MINAQLKTALAAVGHIYDIEDLRALNTAVVDQMRHLSRLATRSFKVGDQVEFDGKNGKVNQGQIVKINQKSIVVDTLIGRWKVSANLLRSIR